MPSVLGNLSYKASNGDHPNEEWKLVLYQNSAGGSQSFHFLGQAWMKQRKNVSRH
jgi:hypothetical protein